MQHPTSTQELLDSTPVDNPDLEAMKSAHSAAVNSNEKIFPIFAKKLASKDTKEYANTARKFAHWLGSEKAYYPAARPKIVQLLEIAFSSFMDNFVHHSAVAADFTGLVRLLLQSVVPFMHLFSEVELQSRLHRLIAEAEKVIPRVPTSTIHGNMPLQGAVIANTPSLALAPPVSVNPQPKVPPIPDAPKSNFQMVSDSGAVKALPNSSTNATSPLSSLVMNTSQQFSENVSGPIPPKPQPKRARRTELSEELIARDLDWFKSNQSSAIVNEEGPGASTSKTRQSSLVPASDTAYILWRPPSPKKKTARMVPSRRLPRRISLDVTRKEDSGASDVVLPPTSEPPADKSVRGTSVQGNSGRRPSQERAQSEAQSVAKPEPRDTPEISPREESQPVVSSSNETPARPEAPPANGESVMSATPFLETALDCIESMNIFTSGSEGFLPESLCKVGLASSPQALRLQSPMFPPLVGAWDPPLNLNFNVSQTSPSLMDKNRQRFDGEVTIVHTTQGKPFTYTHIININLNEDVFSKISQWVRRKSHPLEAHHGVCISLGCYRLSDFFEIIDSGNGQHDIEALISQSSCSWPNSNRLSLFVNDDTRQTVITLSPPFFLTPDQCVDISSLTKSGNNTLEIRQHGDMSEYLIVFHAHHPTQAQLAEFDAVNVADERWKRFLDVLSARAMPEKMIGTASTSVVGVF